MGLVSLIEFIHFRLVQEHLFDSVSCRAPHSQHGGAPFLVYYSARSCLIAISLTHILDVFIFTLMYLFLLSHVWNVSLDSKGVMST